MIKKMDGRKFFLNVSKGKFFEPNVPGQLNTKAFEEITGHLVNITFKSHEKGQLVRLHVVDENNFYCLSMFANSRPGNAFFLLIKNIDLLEPMTFKMSAKDGKDFFSIHQFGGPVRWYYNQENVNELPIEPNEKTTFFLRLIQEEIIPALQKKLNPFPNHLHYKPAGSGLRGNYFDGFKNSARLIGPIGEAEKDYWGTRPQRENYFNKKNR